MTSDLNAARAAWAEVAVRAFAKHVNADNEPQAVKDLLCDLGHFCDRTGLDYLQLIVIAVGIWKAEIADPQGLAPEPTVTISVAGEEVSFS